MMSEKVENGSLNNKASGSVDNVDGNNSENEASGAVNEVKQVAIKIPPFWKANPALWFCQIESQFITKGIKSQKTKYHTVVASIESEVVAQVSDIILEAPTENQYTKLKERLLERYADSEEKRLKKLLQEIELGDRLPSHLLREMKELAGTRVSEEFLKSLWLQRLPQQTQAILSVSAETLFKQAALADKISQVADHSATLCSISSTSTSSSPPTTSSLQKEIHALSRKIDELMQSGSRSRGRSTNRQRSKSRGRSFSRSDSSRDLCWYHFKFQDKANKCVKPCNYSKSEN